MRNHDVNDLFNNNALLNSLLRRSRNHLVRVSVARSETPGASFTLGLLDHFSASSSVSFSPTFFYTCRTASHGSSSRADNSCSTSCQSSRSAPAVPRQSSAPADWSSTLLVVTCSATMFVGRHVCCAVCVMRHCILTLPFVSLVSGHPRPSLATAPVTVGVLAGTHWGDDSSSVMSHQSANPCGCVV